MLKRELDRYLLYRTETSAARRAGGAVHSSCVSDSFTKELLRWPYVADVRVTFYSLLLSGYARHTIGADNFGRYLNYTLINTLLYIFQSTCRSLRMRRENPSLGFREPRVQRALYPIRKGALQTARTHHPSPFSSRRSAAVRGARPSSLPACRRHPGARM